MKTTRKRFRVRGNVLMFPFDMLRYDCCWPETSHDARLIERCAESRMCSEEVVEELRKEIVETGITLLSDSVHAPCVGRWQSFGWGVAEVLR